MARALVACSIAALSPLLNCGLFAAPTDPTPRGVAAYKQYFANALKNPTYSAVSPGLHSMNIKSVRVYSACIGQHIGATACPTADYFLGCGFADAHATDPDTAAAQKVCGEHASAQYGVQRIKVYNGDRCGYIIDATTCAF